MSAQVALRQGSAGNPSCRWYVVRNLPKDGRGRMFAMRQLRSIAAHGGYAVRNRGGQVPPVTGQTSGSLGRAESASNEFLGQRVSGAQPSADDKHAHRHGTSVTQSQRGRLGVGSCRPNIINHEHMSTDDEFRRLDRELTDSNHAVTARVGSGYKYGIDGHVDRSEHVRRADHRRRRTRCALMNPRKLADARCTAQREGWSSHIAAARSGTKFRPPVSMSRRTLGPHSSRTRAVFEAHRCLAQLASLPPRVE